MEHPPLKCDHDKKTIPFRYAYIMNWRVGYQFSGGKWFWGIHLLRLLVSPSWVLLAPPLLEELMCLRCEMWADFGPPETSLASWMNNRSHSLFQKQHRVTCSKLLQERSLSQCYVASPLFRKNFCIYLDWTWTVWQVVGMPYKTRCDFARTIPKTGLELEVDQWIWGNAWVLAVRILVLGLAKGPCRTSPTEHQGTPCQVFWSSPFGVTWRVGAGDRKKWA